MYEGQSKWVKVYGFVKLPKPHPEAPVPTLAFCAEIDKGMMFSECPEWQASAAIIGTSLPRLHMFRFPLYHDDDITIVGMLAHGLQAVGLVVNIAYMGRAELQIASLVTFDNYQDLIAFIEGDTSIWSEWLRILKHRQLTRDRFSCVHKDEHVELLARGWLYKSGIDSMKISLDPDGEMNGQRVKYLEIDGRIQETLHVEGRPRWMFVEARWR